MGISPVYRKWRLDRGLPIGPPQQEATEVEISVPEPEINEAVSPTVSVLSALDRMKNPVVLDKGPRETIWNAMYGDGPHVGAICGPFEIILPSWLDFEGLVCGKDGGLIDQIQDGTIAPYQRISWYNTGGRPFALVVGLSADVNPRFLSVQYCMRDLWSGVLQWAIEAYNGGSSCEFAWLPITAAKAPISITMPALPSKISRATSLLPKDRLSSSESTWQLAFRW